MLCRSHYRTGRDKVVVAAARAASDLVTLMNPASQSDELGDTISLAATKYLLFINIFSGFAKMQERKLRLRKCIFVFCLYCLCITIYLLVTFTF